MKDSTTQIRVDGSVAVGRLSPPMQAAPIDRTSQGGALSGDTGVNPSILGILGGLLKNIL